MPHSSIYSDCILACSAYYRAVLGKIRPCAVITQLYYIIACTAIYKMIGSIGFNKIVVCFPTNHNMMQVLSIGALYQYRIRSEPAMNIGITSCHIYCIISRTAIYDITFLHGNCVISAACIVHPCFCISWPCYIVQINNIIARCTCIQAQPSVLFVLIPFPPIPCTITNVTGIELPFRVDSWISVFHIHRTIFIEKVFQAHGTQSCCFVWFRCITIG